MAAIKKRTRPLLNQFEAAMKLQAIAMEELVTEYKEYIHYEWRPLIEFVHANDPMFFSVRGSRKHKNIMFCYQEGQVSQLVDMSANFRTGEVAQADKDVFVFGNGLSVKWYQSPTA